MNIKRDKLIKCLSSEEFSFNDRALLIYEYQKAHNKIYRSYLEITHQLSSVPRTYEEIPCCPVGLFKTCDMRTGDWKQEQIFLSSGTTQMSRSKHNLRSLVWYHRNAEHIWSDTFGLLEEFEFVSLLPNYHDNPASSLLSMVSYFMKHSKTKEERYYLDDLQGLSDFIELSIKRNTRLVLIGVSFALLEYVDQFQHQGLDNMIVMETGGMKKFREELTREGLHHRLSQGFSGATLCSEYGMTECLSQLYAVNGSEFQDNDRMRIIIGDPTDPFESMPHGRNGRINIIDLANIDSMAFISTDDIGRKTSATSTKILGRISNSDLRGCNYLI